MPRIAQVLEDSRFQMTTSAQPCFQSSAMKMPEVSLLRHLDC